LDESGSTVEEGGGSSEFEQYRKTFREALENDLNTSAALSALFDAIRTANTMLDSGEWNSAHMSSVAGLLSDFEDIFGIPLESETLLDSAIEELIQRRNEARKSKDYAEADRIRDELKEQGIILEDTPGGVRWKRT